MEQSADMFLTSLASYRQNKREHKKQSGENAQAEDACPRHIFFGECTVEVGRHWMTYVNR